MEPGRRVFVVDDEAVVLKALERMLRSNGFAVEAFAAAEALLERLPYDGIACVLIDLRMPGVSGLELQEVMSRRGLTMPIIFLSADFQSLFMSATIQPRFGASSSPRTS